MSDQSYGLRFDIYERVHLSTEEIGIDELEEIELYPRIQVFSGDDYATLRGHLLLTGLYRGEGETRELSHLIPVEITVPLNRVNRLEDISVEIENFDVDLLNERSLNVTGVLSLQGIETAAAFTPVPQDWTNREYLVSYEQGDEAITQNDPWITADASTLQTSNQSAGDEADDQSAELSQKVFVSYDAGSPFAEQLQVSEQETADYGKEAGAASSTTDYERFGQEEGFGFRQPEVWVEPAEQPLVDSEESIHADLADEAESELHFGKKQTLPDISFASLDNPSFQEERTEQVQSQSGWNIFGDVQAQSSSSASAANEQEQEVELKASNSQEPKIPVWRLDPPESEKTAQAASSNAASAEADGLVIRSEEPAPEKKEISVSEEKVNVEKPAEEQKEAENIQPENKEPENVLPENVVPENLPADNNAAPKEENDAPEEEKSAELKIGLGSQKKKASGKEPFGFSKLLHSKKDRLSEEIHPEDTEAFAETLLQADREDRLWKQAFISSLDNNTPFRKVRMVIVQREDTIEDIADRYSISARELLLHNRLSEQNLSEGQVLYLP